MEKLTFVYQVLPGDRVKVYSPQRNESQTFSKQEFEEQQNDPKLSKVVSWVEHKANDIAHDYETDSGFKFSFIRKKKKKP